MKYLTTEESTMTSNKISRALMALALGSTFLLGACGGGGAAGSASNDEQSTETPLITTLKEVVAAAGFDWATSQPIAPAFTIRRVDGAALGEGWKISLADHACTDAVLGDFETPVATSQYLSFPLSTANALLSQVIVETGAWQLPAGKSDVLVEAYLGNIVYYSRRHAVKDLSTLNVVLPSTPPSTANAQDRAYLDLCR